MVTAKHGGTETEIRTLDELVDVLKEVRADNKPLVLQIDGEEIVFKPAPQRKRRTKEEREQADEEAFLSSFGSWKGLVDGDQFMRRVREGRSSIRPAVTLSRSKE